MDLREFFRFHLLKVLLGLVALQLIILTIIQNYNHRPVAQTDKTEVIEDRTVKISPLINDTDKDKDDELAFKTVSSPLNGKVEQNANLVYYTPNIGFTGTDSLAYTVTDGKKESKPSFIVIQVNKNLPPVSNRDIATIYSGGKIVINVLANDTDNEGDSILIKSFAQPAFGQLHLIENNLVYTANNSSAVTDSFVYVASDGKSNSNETTVLINVKSKNDPCYPWLSSDVGDAVKPGSLSCMNNSIIIDASGSDIWNNRDGFHYAYQYVNGDCDMVTKIESLDGTNEWAKAGLMIRENLDGGSKLAFVCVTNRNGVATHHRTNTNNSMEGGNGASDIKAPYWVKINRTGDVFAYYMSADGKTWKELGNTEVGMTKNVYIGFAVTSHSNDELCKVTFSNSKLTSKSARFEFSEQ